jgi:betaine-aldehyde dehydrogenase
MKISKDLEFGGVWINDHLPATSGVGKDLSHESVKNYKITKHVMVTHS